MIPSVWPAGGPGGSRFTGRATGSAKVDREAPDLATSAAPASFRTSRRPMRVAGSCASEKPGSTSLSIGFRPVVSRRLPIIHLRKLVPSPVAPLAACPGRERRNRWKGKAAPHRAALQQRLSHSAPFSKQRPDDHSQARQRKRTQSCHADRDVEEEEPDGACDSSQHRQVTPEQCRALPIKTGDDGGKRAAQKDGRRDVQIKIRRAGKRIPQSPEQNEEADKDVGGPVEQDLAALAQRTAA